MALIGCTCLMALAWPAAAQTQQFDIPGGSLDVALRAFTQQARVQLIFRPDDVRGRKTGGVQGVQDAQVALQQLLSGTGLAVQRDSSGAIAIFLAGGQKNTPAAAPSDQVNQLEIVTVTAQRREENIQTVPVSVTALSGDDLRQNYIKTAADLQNVVPSLNVTNTSTRSDYSIQIRGMGPTGGLVGILGGGGSGVAAYFSDAATTAAGPGLFFDLESVQVLRGPQGTLFGKNTTGGAILFTPKRPTNEFEGYVEVSAGDYDLKNIDAAINIPIVSDKVLLRVSGERYERSGFTIDRGPQFPGKDYDNINWWAGRVSLLLRPSSNLENYTIFNVMRSDTHGDGYVLSAVNPAGFNSAFLPFLSTQQAAGPRSTAFSTNEVDKRYNWGVFNTTTLQLSDNASIKNIFSYQVQKLRNANDIDATTFVADDLVGPATGWHTQLGTYTEELLAQGSALNDDLKWTTGLYYQFSHNIAPQPFQINAAGGFVLIQPDATNSNRSEGIYAQGTYDLGGLNESLRGLKLTAGYRYTSDGFATGIGLYSPTIGNACIVGSGTYPSSNCFFSGSGRSNGQSWTLSLDRQLSDNVLVYIRSGHGYIPGGFNPGIGLVPGGTNLPQFKFAPESNIDVEVGTKTKFDLAGIPVVVNADVFRTDFANIQRIVSETVIAGISSSFTTNASDAVIQGIELETIMVPFEGFTLAANYSYEDGKYTKIDPLAAPSLIGIPFAYLPAHQVSLSGKYLLPIVRSIGDVSIGATYSYQSKFFSAPAVQPLDYIEGRDLLNLRLSWERVMQGPWDLSFFVNNATNNTYRVGQNNNYYTDGFITSFYGEPRMLGFELRYNFGGH